MSPIKHITALSPFRRAFLEMKCTLNMTPTLNGGEMEKVKSAFNSCLIKNESSGVCTLNLKALNDKLGLRQSKIIQQAIKEYRSPSSVDNEYLQGGIDKNTESYLMTKLKKMLDGAELNLVSEKAPAAQPGGPLDIKKVVLECAIQGMDAVKDFKIKSPQDFKENHEKWSEGNGNIRRAVTNLQGLSSLSDPTLNSAPQQALEILNKEIPLGSNRGNLKFSQFGTKASEALENHFEHGSPQEKETVVQKINDCFICIRQLHTEITKGPSSSEGASANCAEGTSVDCAEGTSVDPEPHVDNTPSGQSEPVQPPSCRINFDVATSSSELRIDPKAPEAPSEPTDPAPRTKPIYMNINFTPLASEPTQDTQDTQEAQGPVLYDNLGNV